MLSWVWRQNFKNDIVMGVGCSEVTDGLEVAKIVNSTGVGTAATEPEIQKAWAPNIAAQHQGVVRVRLLVLQLQASRCWD